MCVCLCVCVQVVQNHVYNMCFPVRDSVVYVLSRFMPVRCGWPGTVFSPTELYFPACGGAKCHTGLLLWLCRDPKLPTVWLAAAGVL